MSCRTWIPLLVNYFSTIKEMEAQIEEIRLEICQNPLFNPVRLFNLIDIDEKNFISLNDLRIYLNKQFLPFEEQCLRRFIHNFSKDENFKINYRDFFGIILPKTNLSIANSLKNKNYSFDNIENKSNYVIENSFKKLIQLELNLVKTLSQISEQLKNSKDFIIYEAFIAIVKFDKYITSDNLNEFLKEYNININSNSNDSQNIMFRLDLDGDGKISYEEFVSIFYPFKDNYSLSDIQNTKVNKNTYTINDLNKNNINQPYSNINNSNIQNSQIQNNLSPNYDDENNLNNSKSPSYLKNYNISSNQFQTNNLIRSNNIINSNIYKSPNNMYSNDYKNKLSFIKVNRNPCNQINKLSNSPLSFDYKKGINKKARYLSIDNSINDLNSEYPNNNRVNISSYYNSMFKNKNSSSLPKNYNYNIDSYNKNYSKVSPNYISSKGINESNDNIYINKLRTYLSSKKQNYNNSLNNSLNEIENTGRGYFTKSQRFSPNRSHIMTSEIVNLPFPNNIKKKN